MRWSHRIGMWAVLLGGALAVAGCHHPLGHETPADKLARSFATDRDAALVADGVRTVTDATENLSTIDCMVFNQAAQQVQNPGAAPTTLGAWSALEESLHIRLMAGCAQPVDELVDYETARRGLEQSWGAALATLPGSDQIVASDSRMGKLLTQQINDVTTESTVCLADQGATARAARRSFSITLANQTCGGSSLVLKWNQECSAAWTVAAVQDKAVGPRSHLSWLSELVSRYKMAYLVCSPSATQEYLAFRPHVPQDLFQGPAYRLAVPIDPILACSTNLIRQKQGSPYVSFNPDTQWVTCSTQWNLQSVSYLEVLPSMFTPKMLQATGSSWLFDPQKANLDPGTWTFNACEQAFIGQMRAAGLNPFSPRAVHTYCRLHGTNR